MLNLSQKLSYVHDGFFQKICLICVNTPALFKSGLDQTKLFLALSVNVVDVIEY